VKVRDGEAVGVRVCVADEEGVIVADELTVGVIVGVAAVTVKDPVVVTEETGILVSVPKIPMGMTVAAPVLIGWRVKIESLQAGGVRISWLMGSTITRRCFT